MPDRPDIVVNTGPLLALIAATGDLEILRSLYRRVVVPWEVAKEMEAGGPDAFGLESFGHADWLERWPRPMDLSDLLKNLLDSGEAAVIQLALNERIGLVCLDDAAGRRVARLSNLRLTGSVGILLRAKSAGYPISIRESIQRDLSATVRALYGISGLDSPGIKFFRGGTPDAADSESRVHQRQGAF